MLIEMPARDVAFYLHSFFPGDPKVASGQEAGDSVPSQVMDPALFPQLRHDRVDPRKSCLSLFHKRPSYLLTFLYCPFEIVDLRPHANPHPISNRSNDLSYPVTRLLTEFASNRPDRAWRVKMCFSSEKEGFIVS